MSMSNKSYINCPYMEGKMETLTHVNVVVLKLFRFDARISTSHTMIEDVRRKKFRRSGFVFDGHDVLQPHLATCISAVRQHSVIGEDLWQSYVCVFGFSDEAALKNVEDPGFYDASFLLHFLQYAKDHYVDDDDYTLYLCHAETGQLETLRADRHPRFFADAHSRHRSTSSDSVSSPVTEVR